MIASRTCFALRPDVVSTVIDDGAVLLDLESKYFYELNASGWFIASRLEAGASLSKLLADCRGAGMPEHDEATVHAFVSALEREALVEVCETDDDSGSFPTECVWTAPSIRKQREPLQQVMVSAFDPSVPLME